MDYNEWEKMLSDAKVKLSDESITLEEANEEVTKLQKAYVGEDTRIKCVATQESYNRHNASVYSTVDILNYYLSLTLEQRGVLSAKFVAIERELDKSDEPLVQVELVVNKPTYVMWFTYRYMFDYLWSTVYNDM